MQPLALIDHTSDETHWVLPRRLFIAGFTGRDQGEVDKHLAELEAFGASVPDETPVFFQLRPTLLTTASEIAVHGAFTSGEVEPVVVVQGSRRLLAVGSDHTDRDLERESLAKSKEACPKVVSTTCVPVDAIAEWDSSKLESWVDGDARPYQEGRLSSLLPLEDLVERLDRRGISFADGDVLFMGTVPLADGRLRPADRFRGLLHVPDVDAVLSIDYRITQERRSGSNEEA